MAKEGNPGSLIHGGVQALPPRQIRILGVPLDLGQSRRGVDMGPSAVRVAGLEARLESLGHVVSDGGNVGVAIAETRNAGDANAKYLKEISETCERVASIVLQTLEEGITPMILGGDHSVAAGSVSGVAEFHRRHNQKIGLLWIDAHADINPHIAAVRVAGLEARLESLGHAVSDGGNVGVAIAETRNAGDANAKYLKEISETCERVASIVLQTLEEGITPMILGGDHSVAAGSVSGVAEFHRRHNQKIGLLWIDAHADINTPLTSPSGNVHGMPLAALLGLGPAGLSDIFGWAPKVAPENTVLIGVRDIDKTEKENIRRAGIAEVYTMRDIDERSMRTVMEEALRAAGRGTAGYHVSLDMDWVDPEDAPGVGTPVRGGATYREAHLAMEILADHGRLLSLEIVEVNPVIDEHNRTAELAVELICSAFGKKIL